MKHGCTLHRVCQGLVEAWINWMKSGKKTVAYYSTDKSYWCKGEAA